MPSEGAPSGGPPSGGPPSGGRGTLARLGRALLDATLLLVALILVLLLLLTVQVRGIVSDARALVDARAVQTDLRLTQARAALDRALEQAQTPAPATPGAIARPPGDAAAAEALRAARAALADPAQGGAPPRPLADGLMRQMALTILALAAQEIRAAAPQP
jgi:hypothetical protein